LKIFSFFMLTHARQVNEYQVETATLLLRYLLILSLRAAVSALRQFRRYVDVRFGKNNG